MPTFLPRIKPVTLFAAAAFILFGVFTFYDSFKYSLFGDDWFILYIIKSQFGEGKQFSYFNPASYFHPWGGQYIVMSFLSNVFGYWELAYFILAFILRLSLAALTFKVLTYLLKDKLISFLSCLAVIASYAGIESTSSVLHMTVYISGIFTVLSMYWLLKSQDKSNLRIFVLAMLSFALALATTPIRTHGLLFFIFFLELFYWVYNGNRLRKVLLLRLVSIVGTALLIYKLGFFGTFGLGGEWNWFRVDIMGQMASNGNFTFLTSYLTNLGKVFVPDNLLDLNRVVTQGTKELILFGVLMLEMALVFVFSSVTKLSKKSFILGAGMVFLFNLLVLLIQKGFFQGGLDDFLATLFGTFLFAIGIWVLILRFLYNHRDKALTGLVFGPVLIITSLIVPLVLMPGATLDSSHRYFTLSLVAVPFIFAGLLTLIKSKKIFTFAVFVYCVFLIYNSIANRTYFEGFLPSRDAETGRKMWEVLFNAMPNPYPDKYLLFYFDATSDPAFAHNTVQFGFPPRMAIRYEIKDGSNIPAFTNDYPEMISAVTDGQAFKRLGHEVKPIGLDQVYAFRILRGEVVDITSEVREDLQKHINE